MDTFDELNQTTQVTETVDEPKQEEDSLELNFTTNTTVAASTNPFENIQQQQQPQQHSDSSWMIDDILTDTTPQMNPYDDDTLANFTSAPPATTSLFDDELFTNQSNTNEFETSNLPPTADELLYNDTDREPSGNNSSFNIFSNPVSSPSTTTVFSPFSSSDPLQAFNARRQQELAEMEIIEKQKIEELRKQGKIELERWYEDRRRNMEQKRQSMKQAQADSLIKALEKSDKETCDWAKVIRFLDFSQGTQLTKQKRDINRMRAVIIQAKRDKDVRKSENGV